MARTDERRGDRAGELSPVQQELIELAKLELAEIELSETRWAQIQPVRRVQ
jgi:hypothetical protein